MSIVIITVEKQIHGLSESICEKAQFDTKLAGLANEEQKMHMFLSVAKSLKEVVDQKGEEAKGLQRTININKKNEQRNKRKTR